MATKQRRFTASFRKRVALEAMRGEQAVQAIAAKHPIHPDLVSTWKRQAVDGLDEMFAARRSKRYSEHEETIRTAHAKLEALTMERAFLIRQ